MNNMENTINNGDNDSMRTPVINKTLNNCNSSQISIISPSGDSCAICLCPMTNIYKDDEPDDHCQVIRTKCKHSFHENCLREVKERKAECPLCRSVLSPLDNNNYIESTTYYATTIDPIYRSTHTLVTREAVIQAASRARNAVRLKMINRQTQREFINILYAQEV